MKTFLFPAVIAFLAFASFPQQASDTQTVRVAPESPSIQELQQIANEWVAAYNAKDGAKVASFYTEDADYISSHVPSLVAHGRENIRANFQKGMDSGGHVDAVEVLSCTFSCDLASVVCRYEATNSGQKAAGRNVIVLKRVNGRWLFHTHVTVVS